MATSIASIIKVTKTASRRLFASGCDLDELWKVWEHLFVQARGFKAEPMCRQIDLRYKYRALCIFA